MKYLLCLCVLALAGCTDRQETLICHFNGQVTFQVTGTRIFNLDYAVWRYRDSNRKLNYYVQQSGEICELDFYTTE